MNWSTAYFKTYLNLCCLKRDSAVAMLVVDAMLEDDIDKEWHDS